MRSQTSAKQTTALLNYNLLSYLNNLSVVIRGGHGEGEGGSEHYSSAKKIEEQRHHILSYFLILVSPISSVESPLLDSD